MRPWCTVTAAACGGALLLAVLGAGVLVWSSVSRRSSWASSGLPALIFADNIRELVRR
ncbi:MAG: hypothetical protein R3C32_05030 [Chloroflexota bacterium]